MSGRDAELVPGGRYQVMPVRARDRVGSPELSLVFLDLWDRDTNARASARLQPDEARELARQLDYAAHMADLGARR